MPKKLKGMSLKSYTLKGIRLVENIIAFAIILGVLALAFAGLTVSENYVQRGRSTTEASETAELLMEKLYTKSLSITSDADRDNIITGVDPEYSGCVDISAKTAVTLDNGQKVIGRYITVKILVPNIKTERYVTYRQFVPTEETA